MITVRYNRDAAINYARTWAFERNPEYYDFSGIGGDCTNFASQCVYAGCRVMNYTPELGWYYVSVNDRSPSWTGASFFYNFMTTNQGVGPFGEEASLDRLALGDLIQLSNEAGEYYHTLVLTGIARGFRTRQYYVTAHSIDAYQRNLNNYNFAALRGIHIIAARRN